MSKTIKETGRPMVIRFYAREVYGNTLFYAVDYQTAIQFLTGRKTMTPRDMECLEELGFKLEEVLDPNRKEMRNV